MTKSENNMGLPQPIYDFFFEEVRDSEKIRVHCPTQEQREELCKIAKMFFTEFSTEYLHYESHNYLLWDRLNFSTHPIGFNGYAGPNSRTYEFEDFMKLIPIFQEDETILDVEDLL